jgi:hypothetical protein
MTTNSKKRFLRDGILDGMIKRLREIDNQNWTLEKMAVPTTAAIIELFELNRLLLKELENLLDKIKDCDPEWYESLLPMAHNIQEGLRNTYAGFEDEWEHFVNNTAEEPFIESK